MKKKRPASECPVNSVLTTVDPFGKCPVCRTKLKTTTENIRYDFAWGLDFGMDVVLVGVQVTRCPGCGLVGVDSTGDFSELNTQLSIALIKKPARLAPGEIRFLRQVSLCAAGGREEWSGTALARALGVAPEVVSRWENKGGIGALADKALRLLVQVIIGYERFDLEALIGIADDDTGVRLRCFPGDVTWTIEPVDAVAVTATGKRAIKQTPHRRPARAEKGSE